MRARRSLRMMKMMRNRAETLRRVTPMMTMLLPMKRITRKRRIVVRQQLMQNLRRKRRRLLVTARRLRTLLSRR